MIINYVFGLRTNLLPPYEGRLTGKLTTNHNTLDMGTYVRFAGRSLIRRNNDNHNNVNTAEYKSASGSFWFHIIYKPTLRTTTTRHLILQYRVHYTLNVGYGEHVIAIESRRDIFSRPWSRRKTNISFFYI